VKILIKLKGAPVEVGQDHSEEDKLVHVDGDCVALNAGYSIYRMVEGEGGKASIQMR
jgi:hypothetical protein